MPTTVLIYTAKSPWIMWYLSQRRSKLLAGGAVNGIASQLPGIIAHLQGLMATCGMDVPCN